MSSLTSVPDAWDDDWVDSKAEAGPAAEDAKSEKKLTKAERKRQQLELNKKLWDEAQAPDLPYFIQKSHDVPLQSGLQPVAPKVLSRKPARVAVARQDPTTGVKQLRLQDDGDGDDDDDDDTPKAMHMTAEERTEKARKEREEKQKKYDEARQRLFGSPAPEQNVQALRSRSPVSGGSSGGERGRGRGTGRAGTMRARMAGIGRASPGRQLFDPNAPKGSSASSSGRSTPVQGAPTRPPRGPDGSTGFGQGAPGHGSRGSIS